MTYCELSEAEVDKALAACIRGDCVSCYGPVNRMCAAHHELYCCDCDDTNCVEPPPGVEPE